MIIFYIFAQGCQGVQFDAGVAVNTTDAKGDLPMDQDIQKIPSEADFVWEDPIVVYVCTLFLSFLFCSVNIYGYW